MNYVYHFFHSHCTTRLNNGPSLWKKRKLQYGITWLKILCRSSSRPLRTQEVGKIWWPLNREIVRTLLTCGEDSREWSRDALTIASLDVFWWNNFTLGLVETYNNLLTLCSLVGCSDHPIIKSKQRWMIWPATFKNGEMTASNCEMIVKEVEETEEVNFQKSRWAGRI